MRRLSILLLLVFFVPAVTAQDEEELQTIAAPTQPAKTTLRARVYYEDNGRPVKRTNVMLFGKGPAEASGTTDGNGILEIKGLKAGRYFAMINAPGVLSPLAHIDMRRGGPGLLDEGIFDGVPAIEVDGLTDIVTEIVARRGAAIGGRITYADGTPAIGVTVEVLRKVGDEFLAPVGNLSSFVSLMSGGTGGFKTDDRGIYRSSGLPGGDYIVKVTENVSHTKSPRSPNNPFDFGLGLLGNPGSLVSTFFENALTPDTAEIITVQVGQEMSEVNLVIPDRELHSLEGRLIAAKDKLPIRRAKLTIRRVGDEKAVSMFGELAGSRFGQAASTDEKGNWKFTELPKGTYQITAEAVNSEFDAKDRAYGVATGDDFEFDLATNANATASNAMSGARRGQPVKPPAPKFAKTIREFTIDDKDLGEQIIELAYGATIIGTITFEEEATKERGSVVIATMSDKGGIGSQQSLWFTDYQGKLTYLNSKDFRLDAIPSGRSTVSITASDTDSYVKSAASNQIDLLKGPIDFKEGDVFANVRIVISNQTGTLKGTVVDRDKQPVGGVELVFMPTDPAKFRNSTYFRSVKSRSNGEFEVKLPPFEYALVATPPPAVRGGSNDDYYNWLAEAVKKTQTFRIEAGKTTTATIKWEAAMPKSGN
jgi:hypothetical protein